MKKILFYLLLVFGLTNINSQNKDIYGIVYYKYKPNYNQLNKDTIEIKKHVKDFFKKINKFSDDVQFKLEFLNRVSVFKIDEKMENDFNSNSTAFVQSIVSNGSYYCDLENDIQYRRIEEAGNKLLIQSRPSEIKWLLTGETKVINNFKCYKAISKLINVNNSGVHKFTIIAWYTPEIPVSFGPKQYNGLPGLILELKDTHNTFFANKIELFPKEKIRIKPFKGDTISEKNYKKKLRRMMKGVFIQNKN